METENPGLDIDAPRILKMSLLTIQKLLKLGADPNLSCPQGWTVSTLGANPVSNRSRHASYLLDFTQNVPVWHVFLTCLLRLMCEWRQQNIIQHLVSGQRWGSLIAKTIRIFLKQGASINRPVHCTHLFPTFDDPQLWRLSFACSVPFLLGQIADLSCSPAINAEIRALRRSTNTFKVSVSTISLICREEDSQEQSNSYSCPAYNILVSNTYLYPICKISDSSTYSLGESWANAMREHLDICSEANIGHDCCQPFSTFAEKLHEVYMEDIGGIAEFDKECSWIDVAGLRSSRKHWLFDEERVLERVKMKVVANIDIFQRRTHRLTPFLHLWSRASLGGLVLNAPAWHSGRPEDRQQWIDDGESSNGSDTEDNSFEKKNVSAWDGLRKLALSNVWVCLVFVVLWFGCVYILLGRLWI